MISPGRYLKLTLPVLLCVVMLTGCARLFPKPMRVPPEAEGLPGMAELRSAAPTPEAFAKAFPPIDTFIMSSRVLAKYRRVLGKVYFEMSMVTAGPKMIRMAGRHPGDRTTVFDMVFNYPKMHVYLPLAGAYYRGDVPPEGSPFGTGFGVEPWDLIPIVEIGQRLGLGHFTAATGPGGTVLNLSEADRTADGLVSVKLDRATSLPSEVRWQRGELEHVVKYEAWGIFESISKPGQKQLVPTEFTIQRRHPYARVEVRPREELDQYKIEPELSKQTFELIFPRETQFFALEELENILGG